MTMSHIAKNTLAASLLFGAVLLSTDDALQAQNLIVRDSTGPGFFESVANSPLYPIGGAAVGPITSIWPGGTSPGLGGVALDTTTGTLWQTDGHLISAEGHPDSCPRRRQGVCSVRLGACGAR